MGNVSYKFFTSFFLIKVITITSIVFLNKGARSSGINGFFKGVGKGLLGLLVKPASGVVDLLTTSLDGIRRYD